MNIFELLIAVGRIIKAFATPATAIASAMVSLGGLLWGISGRLDQIITLIDGIAVSVTGTADFTPLAFANYVFPVDGMIGYIAVYLPLLLITTMIRTIKAWIPTVS